MQDTAHLPIKTFEYFFDYIKKDTDGFNDVVYEVQSWNWIEFEKEVEVLLLRAFVEGLNCGKI